MYLEAKPCHKGWFEKSCSYSRFFRWVVIRNCYLYDDGLPYVSLTTKVAKKFHTSMKESFDFLWGVFDWGMNLMICEKRHRHHHDMCKPISSNRMARLYGIIVSIRTKKPSKITGYSLIFVNYMAQFRANTTERYQRVQPSNKHICFITILKLYTVYIFFYKKISLFLYSFIDVY